MGSVNLLANNATDSMKVLLAYGFNLHSTNQNMIYLTKSLEVL